MNVDHTDSVGLGRQMIPSSIAGAWKWSRCRASKEAKMCWSNLAHTLQPTGRYVLCLQERKYRHISRNWGRHFFRHIRSFSGHPLITDGFSFCHFEVKIFFRWYEDKKNRQAGRGQCLQKSHSWFPGELDTPPQLGMLPTPKRRLCVSGL